MPGQFTGACTNNWAAASSANLFPSFVSPKSFSRGMCDVACSDTVGCIGYQIYAKASGSSPGKDATTQNCMLLGPTFTARSSPSRRGWTFVSGQAKGAITPVTLRYAVKINGLSAYDYTCYKKTTPPKKGACPNPLSLTKAS